MNRQRDQQQTESSILLEERTARARPPRMYQIVMLNDDFTPMDFVVEVLRTFFFKSKPKAMEIMLKIHTTGRAVCGIYTKNVAEMKVTQVARFCKQHEHPLFCKIRPFGE